MHWQHMRDRRGHLPCGQTKMMNECLEATFKFVALPWLKFGEVLEVVVWVEDVLGTLVAVCRCYHFPNSV